MSADEPPGASGLPGTTSLPRRRRHQRARRAATTVGRIYLGPRHTHPARKSARAAVLGLLTIGMLGAAFDQGPDPAPLPRPLVADAATAPSATAPSRTASQEAAARPAGAPAAGQWAVVRRVVDGDTLVLQASRRGVAIDTTDPVRVRLLLVDAPEAATAQAKAECFSAQATGYLARLAAPGSTVWVAADVERLDRYGRRLLYLWTRAGTFVNAQLVASGNATVLVVEPNHARLQAVRAAERSARASVTGLWKACPAAPTRAPAPRAAAPTRAAPPRPATTARSGCDPAYPDVCIPPPSRVGDLDCPDVPYRRFRVLPPDPHRFDGDHDGVGCES